MKNGDSYGFVDSSGKTYNGDNTFINKLTTALSTLQEGETGLQLINDLSGISNVKIQYGYNGTDMSSSMPVVSWDSESTAGGGIDENGSSSRPSYIALGHELAHAQNAIKGNLDTGVWIPKSSSTNVVYNYEKYASYIENKIRGEHKIPLRTHYSTIGKKPFEPTRIIDAKTKKNLFF